MAVECLPDEDRSLGELSWKYLDVELDRVNYLEDFRRILLPKVRPNWNPDNLGHKIFEEGVTNTLVGIYEKPRKEDMVLLRMNGEGTDLFIDRREEILVILALNKADLNVPPVYLQLKNGLCYGFVVGRNVTVEEMRNERMMRKLATVIASLHAVPLPDVLKDKKPQVWAKVEEWLEKVPAQFNDQQKQEWLQKLEFGMALDQGLVLPNPSFARTIGSVDVLRQEVARLKLELSKCNSPICFCHNDLLSANLIYNEENDSVTLIDFEYGGANFQAFDIGDHFCEFAGLENTDYQWYPTEAVQKWWIRIYLQESARLKGSDPNSITEEAVNTLYRDSNKFALAAHMLWCLWGLLQAQYSTIDFNYVEYAAIRFTEFQRRKEEFYAL